MKVKIKKEGNTKEFNLIKSWSDVTLEKWVKLVDLHKGSRSDEALETITALSNIPKQLVKELGIKDVAIIMEKISELQSKADGRLRNTITVEGKEYGFHPELEDITLGEWADIETFIKSGIETNMPEVMAVLYRPIVEKKNKKYVIEAYDGNIAIRAEEFKKMKAEEVQSALVFFWSFGSELLKILPSYLTERTEQIRKTLQDRISQKNGATSE
ncbi:MAG: hypothetical protein CMC55_02235 [Flavobacteriaceae bacterium]|nr:hypothetical protein [Flavobacteriaceae bacterium]